MNNADKLQAAKQQAVELLRRIEELQENIFSVMQTYRGVAPCVFENFRGRSETIARWLHGTSHENLAATLVRLSGEMVAVYMVEDYPTGEQVDRLAQETREVIDLIKNGDFVDGDYKAFSRHDVPRAFWDFMDRAVKLEILDAVEIVALTVNHGTNMDRIVSEVIGYAFANRHSAPGQVVHKTLAELADAYYVAKKG